MTPEEEQEVHGLKAIISRLESELDKANARIDRLECDKSCLKGDIMTLRDTLDNCKYGFEESGKLLEYCSDDEEDDDEEEEEEEKEEEKKEEQGQTKIPKTEEPLFKNT